jgi:hypothetical protein
MVATWIRDMFCKLYYVINFKIVKNSATAEAREKISADKESSIKILEFF